MQRKKSPAKQGLSPSTSESVLDCAQVQSTDPAKKN
jgi:hypothetical protein